MQIHKPEPNLEIITPIPSNAPFDNSSVYSAFNNFLKQDTLGQKFLAINYDLNKVLFTWSFDETYHSSFILIFTGKSQFLNTDIGQGAILNLLEESYLTDPDLNEDGDIDYVFNGVTLIITIRHNY